MIFNRQSSIVNRQSSIINRQSTIDNQRCGDGKISRYTDRVSTSHESIVPARPAASVILIRDAPQGLEVLYLRRSAELAFHGGAWVFPGGRIDLADRAADTDDEAAARRAAVREAREEANLAIAPDELRLVSHWTTPESSRIRFATWFFAARAPDGVVRVDGREIIDYLWLKPADAVRAQRERTMSFGPPTFALSTRFSEFDSVADALRTIVRWTPDRLLGRLFSVEDGQVVLYPEDVAYGTGSLNQHGSRHRLWMVGSGWRYERDF
jgi:8-oxo-dGTP pyrophosphatase MutT (NUDIX family)